MRSLYDKVENMYGYFWKERGDMERSSDYEKVIKELPELEYNWCQLKERIQEAKLLFEYKMEKLIEKLEKQEENK